MQVTRGQIYIAGLLVVLVLGVLAGVIVTLETSSTEAAVLVGLIGTLVLPVVGAFISIMQGMTNATKLDATKAKVDAIHESVRPLAERLGEDGK